MNKGYRIMFLRERNGQPVGCVAIGLTKNKSKVKYQISVLNPSDKFDREMARSIALGRLIADPYTVDVNSSVANMHTISAAVMNNISVNAELPSRARRAAARWLKASIV